MARRLDHRWLELNARDALHRKLLHRSQGESPSTAGKTRTTDAARPTILVTSMRRGRLRSSETPHARNAAAATRKFSATQSLRLPSKPSHGIKMKPLANEPAIAPTVFA